MNNFQLQAERDELSKRFVNAILEVQQKTGLKNVLLQKRVQTLTESAEHKEALIGYLATNKQPSNINNKLEV